MPESMREIRSILGYVPTPAECFRLFGETERVGMARKEQEVVDRGERITFSFQEYQLVGHRWGRGPAVVMLHGWGNRAAAMSAFVDPLVEQGFSVWAIDAPAHGESSGEFCHAPLFAACTDHMVKTTVLPECGSLQGALGYSFGGLATGIGQYRGLGAKRIALLAPLAWIPLRFNSWAIACGLDEAGIEEYWQHVHAYFGEGLIETHSLPQLAPHMTAPLLLVHDRKDNEVSVQEALDVVEAWPGAVLMETEGLGHRRLLRDRTVITRVAEFLGQP